MSRDAAKPWVYLDHNSTTPIHEEVIQAMEPFYVIHGLIHRVRILLEVNLGGYRSCASSGGSLNRRSEAQRDHLYKWWF